MHGKVAHIDMILSGVAIAETVQAVPGKNNHGTYVFSFDSLKESTRDLLRELEANKKQMLAGATWEQPRKADKQDQHEGEVLGSVWLRVAKVGVEEYKQYSSDRSAVVEKTNNLHEIIPLLELRDTVDSEQPIGAMHVTK